MPDVALHHAFGMEVLDALSPEIREYIAETPYGFALYGPDPWFVYQIWKRRRGRGRRMHTTATGAFLKGLALRARNGASPRETFSYLAGFLCHYALDASTHPYIIWQTTETWPTRRAHRDMEHALDAALLKREGRWGERHPVTDYHFPPRRLPDCMAEDLAAVYGQVYGWQPPLTALNRCYAVYRWIFRRMENPRSAAALLARLIPTHRFRSLAYSRSAFLDRDVENLSHRPWRQAYAQDEVSSESFPELYRRALEEAVRMITDAYAFIRGEGQSEAGLEQSFGNRSYLSGLDVDDPRNHLVRGLRPPD